MAHMRMVSVCQHVGSPWSYPDVKGIPKRTSLRVGLGFRVWCLGFRI